MEKEHGTFNGYKMWMNMDRSIHINDVTRGLPVGRKVDSSSRTINTPVTHSDAGNILNATNLPIFYPLLFGNH